MSGRRDISNVVRAIAEELARSGCELRVLSPHGPTDVRRLAAEVPDDTRAVIAVGGDGTVRDVAAGLLGRDIPLAVFPAGTENIVARHFKMPTDPPKIAELILHGTSLRHDVGVLNSRHFMIVCGVGFDARVVERLAAARSGHIGYLNYVGPLWSTFWQDEFPLLTVEADGQLLFEGRGLVLVGVQPRYSLGLRILARAIHDDGYLDVCVLPCATRSALIGHLLRTSLRQHVGRGGVIYHKCRVVSITSPQRVPIQCDGDPAGVLPARLEILPSALRLLVPPQGVAATVRSRWRC